MQREIMSGAVLDLHQSAEQADAMKLRAAIFDVLDSRAWTLSGDGDAVNQQRLDFADAVERRLEVLRGARGVSVQRLDRLAMLRRELVAAHPECDDALTLVQALYRGIEDRYGDARCHDLKERFNEVEEALAELDGAYYSDELAKTRQR
jgi:hypothetical protein